MVQQTSMSKKLVIKLDIRPKTQEIPSNLCSFELLVKNTKTALHYSFELGKRVVFRCSSWIIVFCLIFFRDWVSEVERIFVRSTKRKVSGGDFAGSSSPLITESAPNSPASTHYGLASMPFVLIMRCSDFCCWFYVEIW